MGRLRHVALVLIAVAAPPGCAADRSGPGPACFAVDDCCCGNVCFMGRCVDPGYSISQVCVEVTPPNDSALLPQQIEGALDLSTGPHWVTLRSAVSLDGKIASADTESMTGNLVLRMLDAPIPGRDVSRQGGASTSGFAVPVIPGIYSMRFVPDDTGGIARPPLDYLVLDVASPQLLSYPEDSALMTVHGNLRYSASDPTPVSRAQVVGQARDTGGNNVQSTIAMTDTSGVYQLVFPPNAQELSISVHPGTNPDVPDVTFTDVSVSGPDNTIEELVLGVDPVVFVRPQVFDDAGQLIANASILFQGSVGPGRFTATTTTDEKGDVAKDVALRPGDYVVTVTPLKAQPYALSSVQVTIPSAEPVVVVVKRKITLSGVIGSHAGAPVSGARVALQLRNAPVPREFATTTGAGGQYSVAVDPGDSQGPVQYELVVEPAAASGLPRYRELLAIGEGDLEHSIALYAPSFAYGVVRAPDGTPLATAILTFYSTELGSPEAPLLVGMVQTADDGTFVVPLPTLGD